jgi:hypothetical protein
MGEMMNKTISSVIRVMVLAFIMTGAMTNPAAAQDNAAKAADGPKILMENEKVRVLELTYKPGVKNENAISTTIRVVRALKGGTVERTYSDGKKETLVWKTGEVRILEPGPAFTNENVGTSDVQFYIVLVK